VLTNGGNPVVFATDNGVESIAPRPVTPVNAIGCGDAVTAGLAAGLHRGQSLRDAVLLGMDCAWRNVQSEKPGTIR
jgi:1-phosphofructokinase/tagatose 6-phosphate kinase